MTNHQNLMIAAGVLAAIHAILSGLLLGKVNLQISEDTFLGISIAVNVIILALVVACCNTSTHM